MRPGRSPTASTIDGLRPTLNMAERSTWSSMARALQGDATVVPVWHEIGVGRAPAMILVPVSDLSRAGSRGARSCRAAYLVRALETTRRARISAFESPATREAAHVAGPGPKRKYPVVKLAQPLGDGVGVSKIWGPAKLSFGVLHPWGPGRSRGAVQGSRGVTRPRRQYKAVAAARRRVRAPFFLATRAELGSSQEQRRSCRLQGGTQGVSKASRPAGSTAKNSSLPASPPMRAPLAVVRTCRYGTKRPSHPRLRQGWSWMAYGGTAARWTPGVQQADV